MALIWSETTMQWEHRNNEEAKQRRIRRIEFLNLLKQVRDEACDRQEGKLDFPRSAYA